MRSRRPRSQSAAKPSETAGAFASLGMVLNAVLTVALAPMLLALLSG